jgi:hypothetical protein
MCFPGSLRDGREIKDQAARLRVAPQDREQKRPVTSPDIDNRSEAREVIGRDGWFEAVPGAARHGLVEESAHVRVRGEVVVEGHLEYAQCAELARPDYLEDIARER